MRRAQGDDHQPTRSTAADVRVWRMRLRVVVAQSVDASPEERDTASGLIDPPRTIRASGMAVLHRSHSVPCLQSRGIHRNRYGSATTNTCSHRNCILAVLMKVRLTRKYAERI